MSSDEASEKIEQLVFDENKIVTYKVLSLELSIHVNKAKQILNQFITDYFSKGKNDINVCYAISGLQKYNGYQIHKLAVVSKHQLEKAKKNFLTLSSVHVYSIQKTTNLNDCVLFASDSALTKQVEDCSIFSAIKHPNISVEAKRTVKNVVLPDKRVEPKRSEKNIGLPDKKDSKVVGKVALKTEPKAINSSKKTNSLFTTWQKKDNEGKNSSNESLVTKANDKSSSSTSTGSVKNESVFMKKQNGLKNSAESSKAQEKKNSNQIKSMFSKQAEKISVKPIVKASSPLKAEPEEMSMVSSAKEPKAKQVKTLSKSRVKGKNKRFGKSKLREMSESDSDSELKKPMKKKHKRIVMADTDSESENEEERDKAQRSLLETESPVKMNCSAMDEDDEEPIPPTPPVQIANGKCKKMKFVNKTFEDEDGFLVTQRVKEYVTASEDSESEAPVKKDDKSLKPAQKVDVQLNLNNKKQASLTSFFKRK